MTAGSLRSLLGGTTRSRTRIRVLLAVVGVISVIAVPAAGSTLGTDTSQSPLDLSIDAEASSITPDSTVTVTATLTNTGSTTSPAPVFDLDALPAGWSLVSYEANGAAFRESSTEWLWTRLEPDSTKTLTLTLQAPSEAGDYHISSVVTDGNDERATASTTISVSTPSSSPDSSQPVNPGTGGGDESSTNSGSRGEPTTFTNASAIKETVGVPDGAAPTYAERAAVTSGPNGSAVVEFTNDAPVSRIELSDASNGTVSVATLDRDDSRYQNPPGNAVSLFWVSTDTSTANTSGVLELTLTDAQLAEDDLAPQNLKVLHRVDGNWRPLETSVRSRDGGGVVLKAQTDGFSPFAVSAVGTPTARITTTAPATPGETITLDASDSMTPHGNISSYEWRVNDRKLTGETVTVSFDSPGTYTVELVVRNRGNRSASTTTSIVVEADSFQTSGSTTDPSESSNGGRRTHGGTTGASTPGFSALTTLLLVALLGTLAFHPWD